MKHSDQHDTEIALWDAHNVYRIPWVRLEKMPQRNLASSNHVVLDRAACRALALRKGWWKPGQAPKYPPLTSLQEEGQDDKEPGSEADDDSDEEVDEKGLGQAELADYSCTQLFPQLRGSHLRALMARRLSRSFSDMHGRIWGAVRVYREAEVAQLAERVTAELEAEYAETGVRENDAFEQMEKQEEAAEAAAFEALKAAKEQAKAWKRPRLEPSTGAILPVELWTHVFQLLIANDDLLDLKSFAQGMCAASATCKTLFQAAREAWPHLPQHLGLACRDNCEHPCKGPRVCPFREGVAPLNELVRDPVACKVPQLKAACRAAGITGMSTATKAELVTRLMQHAELSHPSSAPLNVILYLRGHTARLNRLCDHQIARLSWPPRAIPYHEDFGKSGEGGRIIVQHLHGSLLGLIQGRLAPGSSQAQPGQPPSFFQNLPSAPDSDSDGYESYESD